MKQVFKDSLQNCPPEIQAIYSTSLDQKPFSDCLTIVVDKDGISYHFDTLIIKEVTDINQFLESRGFKWCLIASTNTIILRAFSKLLPDA